MTKSEIQLRKDVTAVFAFEPAIDSSEIAVSVTKGAVTLSGFVKTYAQKVAAVRAVKRVAGSRDAADMLGVRLAHCNIRADAEIARTALEVLSWETTLATAALSVHVQNGFLTLEGAVNWEFQRSNAHRAVESLAGIRGIVNDIAVKPRRKLAKAARDARQSWERDNAAGCGRVRIRRDRL